MDFNVFQKREIFIFLRSSDAPSDSAAGRYKHAIAYTRLYCIQSLQSVPRVCRLPCRGGQGAVDAARMDRRACAREPLEWGD